MKIAQYKCHDSGSVIISLVTDWIEGANEYVRLSEVLELDFPPLPPEVTVPKELANLDAAEAELRNKFNQKLSELNTQRANLLALTHQTAP